MKANLLKYLGVFILLVFVAGCATTADKGSSELEEEEAPAERGLTATTKLRFNDIPAPEKFKLIQDKSFVFQTEGTRVALLKYAGRADIQDIVDFYREQMLLCNWELLNVVEYDKSILNFERAGESAIVTIEPKGMKKVITISVAPKVTKGLKAEAK